jgi:DNA-binding NtrC family response regulator
MRFAVAVAADYRPADYRPTAITLREQVEVSGMIATKPKPYSILITDDDAGCREALRDIVAEEGYRTVLAASGEEAVDIVRDEPVHLALLDMHMPRLSGLETVQLVRQFNAMLPCILVTADATAELMRQAFNVVYSIIPKPISRHVVLYTVVRALSKTYGKDYHQEEREIGERPLGP